MVLGVFIPVFWAGYGGARVTYRGDKEEDGDGLLSACHGGGCWWDRVRWNDRRKSVERDPITDPDLDPIDHKEIEIKERRGAGWR